MSQPRMHKVVASGEARPRARASVTKASGDSVSACTARPNHETQRSRSKNKIPKSVRYDLENALVSLCDVWFEEIKPHLVRNNIKLHVHGSSAGGDHERPSPSETTARPALPAPPAPGCSHLDPASSAPRCELCRLLLNAANCIESAVYQAASAQPPAPPVAATIAATDPKRLHSGITDNVDQYFGFTIVMHLLMAQSHNCEEKQRKRPRTRRKQGRSKPQTKSSWRVPRLCRTYSVLSPAATSSPTRRIASYQPPQPPPDDYYQFIVPRRNTVMKNKSTQTEEDLLRSCVAVGCQWGAPAPALLVRRAGARTTALSSPRQRTYRHKQQKPDFTESALFQDDLIDIIGEKHDNRLRLLYSSPESDDYPSLLNLFPLPDDRQKKLGGLKKSPPWR